MRTADASAARTIDLLRILLDRAEAIEPPTVSLVRYNVRSGVSLPSKPYMAANDIVGVSWDLPFADSDGEDTFGNIVPNLEAQVATRLEELQDLLGGAAPSKSNKGDAVVLPLKFHGVFPVRGGNGAIARLRVLWSGPRSAVSVLEDWRLGARRSKPTDPANVIAAETALISFVAHVLSYVDTRFGEDLVVSVLDPRLAPVVDS